MGREEFSLLTDDEIRNALDVAATKLHQKLWPRLLAEAPDLRHLEMEFYDKCRLELAKSHGITELFDGATK